MGWLSWLLYGKSEPSSPVSRSNGASGKSAPVVVDMPHVTIAPGRGFTCDVVGESQYQDAIDSFCGGKCEDGYNDECQAELFLDDANEYDPNAVGVKLAGRTVGYLPRDIAAKVRADILRLNPQRKPIICRAKIVGGWDRGDGDEGHYGVKLSLSSPMRLQ